MIAQGNNTKRVLYIYPALPVGGAEKQLYLLVKYLDKERYAPYVCCLVRGGPVADMIRQLGIEVIHAQTSNVYDIRAVWRIKKIIAEKKIILSRRAFLDSICSRIWLDISAMRK